MASFGSSKLPRFQMNIMMNSNLVSADIFWAEIDTKQGYCSQKIQYFQHQQPVDQSQWYFHHSHASIFYYYVLSALKRVMDKGGMDLEIIVNPEVTDDGHSVIQVTAR